MSFRMSSAARAASVSALLLSAPLLAACEGNPSARLQASAPEISFDGTYRGILQPAGSPEGQRSVWCQSDRNVTIQVQNSDFTYAMPHPNVPGNPTPVYNGYIYQTGVVQGQSGYGSISGYADHRQITGLVDGSGCQYTFTAVKS